MSNCGIFRPEWSEVGQNVGRSSGKNLGCNAGQNRSHTSERGSVLYPELRPELHPKLRPERNIVQNIVQSQILAAMLTISSAIVSIASPAQAASPESAPGDIVETIERLETASNVRDLAAVIDLYSPNFQHEDGLNRRELRSVIAQFWNRYETLTYDIELLSWEATPTGYTTETEVTITGQTADDRPYQLESVLRSRQTFVNNRLVEQTTLEEASTLSAGSAPPNVRIQLPDGVAPGERFEFDAIVLEPLGDNFLLGGALEESVAQAVGRDATFIELEPLSAGGLFKTGTAPNEADDLWISGAIVRKDGITIVTQRLPVALAVTR